MCCPARSRVTSTPDDLISWHDDVVQTFCFEYRERSTAFFVQNSVRYGDHQGMPGHHEGI
jgi:hypothetical protein